MHVRRCLLALLPQSIQEPLREVKQRGQRRWRRFCAPLPARYGGAFDANDVEIRLLSSGDVDAYLALYQLPVTPRLRDDLQEQLARPASFCVGLWWRGELIATGWCMEQWRVLNIPGLWITSAWVKPMLRGRGVGTLLHAARVREAQRRGYAEIFGCVAAHNVANQKALAKQGFVQIQRPLWLDKVHAHFRDKGVTAPNFQIWRWSQETEA